jgi:RES domain-containing protein
MIVYRLAKNKYIKDLSGQGSKLHGTRWSPPGIPVVYTAESRALAALEFYVHVESAVPWNTSIATIEVPDGCVISALNISSIPKSWRNLPAPLTLQKFGAAWFASSSDLLLKVPSVLVPNEYNYLINTVHADSKRIKILRIEKYLFDQRLKLMKKT